MKIKATLLASITVAALTLAYGGGGVGGPAKADEPKTGLVQGDPNTVNTGQAQAGAGDFSIAMPGPPSNWNTLTKTGNGVPSETVASLIMPRAFISQPDWTLKLNESLLVSAKVTSASPQTVEYVIKPGAQWSDGTPITADDFIYTWRAQNGRDCPDCLIQEIGGYANVDAIKGQDGGKRVVVTFSTPYGEWRSLFKFILPSHIAAKHGTLKQSFTEYFTNTIPDWSGGPFIIDKYVRDDAISFVPNAKWYGDKPNAKTVKIRIITDQAQWTIALANGELSMMSTEAATDLVAELKNMSADGFKYQLSPGNRLPTLGFNLNNPRWKDAALRTAIFTAIDMKSVIARTVGQFADFVKPGTSLVYLPMQAGYTDTITAAGVAYGSGDVKAATKMLQDVGYTIKDKKLYQPDGSPFPDVTIVTYRRLAFINIARATADDLRAIGITANIVTDPNPFGNYVRPGKYDMDLLNWSMVPFSASKASTSWTTKYSTAYTSPEIDNAIYAAMAAVDPKESIALLQKADKLLMQSATALPYFQPPNLFAYSADIVNLRDNTSLNTGPTYNIWQWGVRAK